MLKPCSSHAQAMLKPRPRSVSITAISRSCAVESNHSRAPTCRLNPTPRRSPPAPQSPLALLTPPCLGPCQSDLWP
eukprot:1523798-Rhodomonas_salina.1